MTKIKISHAHMHQSAFIPGLNKSTNSKGLDQETFRGIEMWLLAESGILECTYQGRRFFIPNVNFQCLVAEPEEATKQVTTEKTKTKGKEANA